MKLSTYRLGTPRAAREGLRVGTVRYLPRGVPQSEWAAGGYFDVWLPVLAPSAELMRAFKHEGLDAKTFFARYRREMARTDPRQVIALLAALAGRTPLAIGCYCEDEARCHRSALVELIREAGRDRL
jgi:uncharacterized protein YeaO (DUF488 family)